MPLDSQSTVARVEELTDLSCNSGTLRLNSVSAHIQTTGFYVDSLIQLLDANGGIDEITDGQFPVFQQTNLTAGDL